MQTIETMNEMLAETFEALTLDATHNIHKVACELKRDLFKLKDIPWKSSQHKTEVNMDNMAFTIDQYVCVMSIFYL